MTEPGRHLTPVREADLLALADGSLDPVRRAALVTRAATDPALAAAIAEQHTAVDAIAAANAEVTAPPELRAFVCEVTEARENYWARWWRWPWAPAMGLVAAAAAAIVIAFGGGPVLDDVMAAAYRPATAIAPPGTQIDGIKFPAFEGWRKAGTRTDRIEGRDTRTVFYERGGRRIAYTIVAGAALEPPLDAMPAPGDVLSFARGDRQVVTWEENGRTCVLSGEVDAATLAGLVLVRTY